MFQKRCNRCILSYLRFGVSDDFCQITVLPTLLGNDQPELDQRTYVL